jgi:hypothetical protein
MSNRKYNITQIGKMKLDDPIVMSMSIRRSKKIACTACGNAIEKGDCYWYNDEPIEFYCISCVGVEGDPEDFSLNEETT